MEFWALFMTILPGIAVSSIGGYGQKLEWPIVESLNILFWFLCDSILAIKLNQTYDMVDEFALENQSLSYIINLKQLHYLFYLIHSVPCHSYGINYPRPENTGAA